MSTIQDSLAARVEAVAAEKHQQALRRYRDLLGTSIDRDLDAEELDRLADLLAELRLTPADADGDARTLRKAAAIEAELAELAGQVPAARQSVADLQAALAELKEQTKAVEAQIVQSGEPIRRMEKLRANREAVRTMGGPRLFDR